MVLSLTGKGGGFVVCAVTNTELNNIVSLMLNAWPPSWGGSCRSVLLSLLKFLRYIVSRIHICMSRFFEQFGICIYLCHPYIVKSGLIDECWILLEYSVKTGCIWILGWNLKAPKFNIELFKLPTNVHVWILYGTTEPDYGDGNQKGTKIKVPANWNQNQVLFVWISVFKRIITWYKLNVRLNMHV